MPTDEYLEAACEIMHDAYERAAAGAGWETNLASRKPWADVPEANKVTMRAAVQALLDWQEEPKRLPPDLSWVTSARVTDDIREQVEAMRNADPVIRAPFTMPGGGQITVEL